MKRLINARAALCAAIGIILGIISGYETYFGNFWVLAVSLFLSAVTFVVFIITRRPQKFAIVLIAIFLIFGHFYVQLICKNQNSAESRQCVITARVTDIGRNGNVKNVLYLEDAVDSNGVCYRGRIKCYTYDGSLFSSGDFVTVKGEIHGVYIVKDSVDTDAVRKNVKYEMTDVVLISQENGPLKLDETIRLYIYNSAFRYMDTNADVTYALLTGDRNAMDLEKKEYFQNAGIIHLLAVSGLHVGFIAGALEFILKRFKLHPLLKSVIILTPLIFYAYICGFSPSVTRALLMYACASVTNIIRGKYDMLSSLSAAVLIILIADPMYLFDVGFQLSSLSVFGIATVYSALNRKLSRRKINKVIRYLLNAVIMSASCGFATALVVAINFSYVPTLGVIVNIIAIPLVSAAFVLSILGLIPWVFHYVLWLADKILWLLSETAKIVAKLDFSVVLVSALTVSVVVSVIWMFIMGGYVNFGKIGKRIANGICCILLIASMIAAVIPKNASDAVFITIGYDDAMVAAVSRDETAVIGNFGDGYAVNNVFEYFDKTKITNCVLYMTKFSECNTENIKLFAETVGIDKVYVLDRSGNDETERYCNDKNIPLIYAERNVLYGNSVKVQSVYDGGFQGAVVTHMGIDVALLCHKGYRVDNFLREYGGIDFIALTDGVKMSDFSSIPTFTRYQHSIYGNYGANKYGKFIIFLKNGNPYLSFR